MSTGRNIASRRTVLQLAGLGAGALGLGAIVGCTPTASDQNGEASDSTTDDFTFASWSLTEAVNGPVIEEQLRTYSSMADNSIDTVSYPYNEYLNQLILQVRGGEFAGPAQLDIAWLSALAETGRLVDLGAYVEGRGYTEAALATGQFEGTQLGLPWIQGAIGLIANAEMLEEIGVSEAELPTTVDEFEEVLVELKRLNGNIIPYAASTKVEQLKDILVWMETFGSPLIEDDRVTIGDDASVEAVAWFKHLYDEGLIAADVDRFDARSLFSNLNTAIYEDAPLAKGVLPPESPDEDLESKLLPLQRPAVGAGATATNLAWGNIVVVIEGESDESAAEFAQWVSSDEETIVSYFEELGLPPTTEAGIQSDAVQSDEFNSAFTERITAHSAPSPFWQFTNYAQMETAVAEAVQEVLIDESTPQDAMRRVGERLNDMI